MPMLDFPVMESLRLIGGARERPEIETDIVHHFADGTPTGVHRATTNRPR